MTFATVSKSLVMGLALLLASSAFAGTKATVNLLSPTSVSGTTLKPGEYKLEWEGTGPNVEVSIMQGKNVFAKVPAKVVDLSSPAPNSAAILARRDDGSSNSRRCSLRRQEIRHRNGRFQRRYAGWVDQVTAQVNYDYVLQIKRGAICSPLGCIRQFLSLAMPAHRRNS